MKTPVPRVAAGALVIAVALAVATPALAGPIDEAARRFVTLAYAGDPAGLSKSEHAATESLERTARNTLRVRCVAVDAVVIRDLSASGEHATVLLDLVLRTSDRETPAAWKPPETISLRVNLVREGEAWLVAGIVFPDEDLADRLLAAGDEERQQLLCAHAGQIGPGVARAAYARAIALTNAAKGDAARAAALAHQLAQLSGDLRTEALALCVDAFVAWNHGDGATAMRLTERSIEIGQALGDPDVLARAWYTRGRVIDAFHRLATRSGYNQERAECYRKALSSAERAEDPSVLVRVLYSMANLAANQDADNLTARRYIDRVLPITREMGDVAAELGCETILSTIYLNQGDGERGLFHHLRALKLAEEHQLRPYPSLLLRTGVILVGEHRYEEARAALAKALPRDERGEIVVAPNVPRGYVAAALSALAHIEADRGNLEEARCIVQEAGKKYGSTAGAPDADLAPDYLARHDYRAALRASLPQIDATPYPDEKVLSLNAAARAYRGIGQSDRGYTLITEAIDIAERLGERVAGDEEQKARSAEAISAAYTIAAQISLDRGDPAEALAVLERGRARVLKDILANGRPEMPADVEAADREERERRERNLTHLSLDAEHARAAGRNAEARRLAEELRTARGEHASFLDGIRARAERRRVTRQPLTKARLQEVLRGLPAPLASVEYIVDDQEVTALVARQDVVHTETIRIERAELERRVSRFADRLAKDDLRTTEDARALHALLVAPIEKYLAGAEAVLVVPDRALWRVPFAALVDKRGRFLVERWAFVYAPSITAYAAMARQKEPRTPVAQLSFLGIADPKLDHASASALTDFYRGATLGSLPDAVREVNALRMRYARSAVVLTGEQATEGRTKAMLGRARIIHFATHALLDNANPMYSRLVLATDSNADENGWLESWEIARLDLHADMVVLAACDTARGRIGGEGVVGLAWSFFIAGTRSLVAAQWKVASGSTARLMIDFHQSLGIPTHNPALSKAQALRDAQLRLLRDPSTARPFYWAAFVLMGDAAWPATERRR
jgi:CHAT domain-containing protein/tetratricopeptide (TPR) repeat protein